MKACLIGEKLSHSYSKEIHEFMGLEYDSIEVKREELEAFLKDSPYEGFNVTIPYKQDVIKYLDEIDKDTEEIGAVNTIIKKNKKLYGYNTDLFGLELGLKRIGTSLKGKNVLILGTGGASKTAYYLSIKNGAKSVNLVSRSGELTYTNVYLLSDTNVIINTTPNGMYPHMNDKSLLDLSKFPSITHVYDLIYNPLSTELLLDAKKLNIPSDNGLYMLVAQALKAEELWNVNKDIPVSDVKTINRVYRYIRLKKANIILEGMPGSGKSTVGRLLSERLSKDYVDVDAVITSRIGMSITDYITKNGEEAFRNIESDVIKELSLKNSLIIALGGGSILREENRKCLKKNGIIVYVKRDNEKLSKRDRPISQAEGIDKIYKERRAIYESFMDFSVDNNTIVNDAVDEIYQKLNTL